MQRPQIDYAPAPPSYRRRRIRRILIVAIVLPLLALLGWKSFPPARQHAGLLYWQHKAMNYSPPEDQVVCTRDVPKIAADPSRFFNSDAIAFLGGQFRVAQPWDKFYALCSPPGRRSQPTLFLHERRNNGGERHLVAVELEDLATGLYSSGITPKPTEDGFTIRCLTFLPGNGFRSPLQLSDETHFIEVPSRGSVRHTVWYAGRTDPADPSHFTIRCEINDESMTIDGWLTDQDTIILERRKS